ncbi:MAG TPA: two-component system sensor histidine kinase KdpD [Burkholderiaceae bacterium]|jgi:two-component system sensor histidine kinase KdpD
MCPSDYQRPDPDVLLAQVQAQERRAARGKLRIYFGASAGVGKTYAMLNAARKLQADGHDVIVGVIETHGRSETVAMAEGLTVLSLKSIDYRGKTISEFDIDAALNLHPKLILMDELAHSNAPGSRHPKRWQDVEELLNAGIDVFTTVNVQHLESLNDVVGGITGIRVAETLPDTVFDEADEVVLVDIPADELLARLKAGKVYQAQHAERASKNFFRKGNLIALRELALRRTADRIEDDVQAYRVEKSINAVWKTDAALLACVGPRPGNEHVIRSTARLANQLNAEWHAIYVETPQLQRLSAAQRERILKTLKLAQDLGATTAVLSGSDIAQEIVDYARSHNFSKIVLGRDASTWPWQTPYSKRIATYAPDIDLIETGRRDTNESSAAETSNSPEEVMQATATEQTPSSPVKKARYWGYIWTVAACVLTTLIATPLLGYFELANIVMLFLLSVVLIAVRFGRGPAVAAAFLNVAAFDFFFVPPRFTFAVSDFQYLMVFAVMLVVGLIAGQLTSGLRFQAQIASHRETRARALYEFSRALSGTLQTEQIFEITRDFIQRTFHAKALLLLPDDAGRLQFPSSAQGSNSKAPQMNDLHIAIAQWAFDRETPAGMGTDTLPASSFFYLPLVAPMRARGVLAIQPANRRWVMIPEQRQQLDTFATLAAIALERVHYIEVAQNALVSMESERLRNSLLSALSHDLRTPLTSIVGLSESLTLSRSTLSPTDREFVHALHDEALRMKNLVTNLLDMARIQSGEVKLNLQWLPLEGIVGSALRASSSMLAAHTIQTQLASDLPAIHVDAVLIERVLCNLLENASKYTPANTIISISANVSDQLLNVVVSDSGPGLPSGREEELFEKFTRGERESSTPGVGLGLAICRAIVEAHGGTIRAERALEGGAAFIFTIPLGSPPAMPEDEANLNAEHQTL